MIEFILPYVRQMDSRAIPPYQTFLKAQKRFIDEKYRRSFHQLGYTSDGIKLLRYILQYVDMDYMFYQTNNYDRYTYHVRYIKRNLEDIFDRSRRGRGYYRLFFKQKGAKATEEFLMPVDNLNCILNLPLHSEKWEDWKSIKPLRFWCCDSDEFTTMIVNDRVTYSAYQPNFCIELLDVVSLIFKYFIWLKEQRKNEPAEELAEFTPGNFFLHKYVMCDTIWDLGDMWLLRQLNRVMDLEDPIGLENFNSNELCKEQQYGWIALNSRRGFEAIYSLLHDVEHNVRPEAFLSSRVLFSGSINERFWLTESNLHLPELRQYEWMRFLRDRDLVKLFIKVWSRRPDLPTCNRMGLNLRRDFRRVLLGKPWNYCINPDFKYLMEKDMLEMLDILNTI